MPGLIESATAILSSTERRLETISSNVANASTAGFKRQVNFADVLAGGGRTADGTTLRLHSDMAQGRLNRTENPLDIAISGGGLFQLRAGDEIVYSRQGQFRLAEDGTVVSGQGYVLQQAGGGDLVLQSASVQITEDGAVLDQGRPVGRIAVYAPAEGVRLAPTGGGTVFVAEAGEMEEVASPALRQGMIEASNVQLGDEMVAMMAALRQAEGGARLVQVYDDLLGRAITAFGQGGK